MADSVTYRGGRVNLSTPMATSYNAQATQRGSQMVAQSIDRMVGFFQQREADRIKVEAKEFGAANAPTAEQIQAAAAGGEELTLPGDNNTLFGRVARQAAANTVTDTIELTARQAIDSAVLQSEISRGNPADLRDNLDAIIQGYGSTFDETVPSMSQRLKAKLAMVANSQYSAYHSNYIKQARKDGKAAWMTNLITDLNNIDETLVKLAVGQTDPDTGEVIPGVVDFDAYRTSVLSEASARDFAASEIRALSTLVDTKVVQAANTILINNVMANPHAGGIIKALAIGEDVDFVLSDETKLAIDVLTQSGMSGSEIAATLRTERTAYLTMQEKEEDFVNRNADEGEDLYEAQALEAIANNDEPAIRIALDALASFNNTRAMELELQWRSRVGIQYSDVQTVQYLDRLRDNITLDDVIQNFENLNQADQKKYFDIAKRLDVADLKLAKSIVKGELELPENIELIQQGDPNFANVAIFNRVKAKLDVMADEASRAETDFDPYQAASTVMEELGGEFEEAANALTLDRAKRQASIVFAEIRNNETIAALMGNNADISGAIEALKALKNLERRRRPNRFQKDERIDAAILRLEAAEGL